ncbi:hypothetical protein D4764_17G0003060 [Takifugu flavidus]|uniref:Uncharacterized protein n=1 Tax=Takifugu flavidus TaxID=433684 RepID=A0A5C6NU73_9TELE|nr:hypothetical protein D4764_17G0003060 [Takifugu flavidus]
MAETVSLSPPVHIRPALQGLEEPLDLPLHLLGDSPPDKCAIFRIIFDIIGMSEGCQEVLTLPCCPPPSDTPTHMRSPCGSAPDGRSGGYTANFYLKMVPAPVNPVTPTSGDYRSLSEVAQQFRIVTTGNVLSNCVAEADLCWRIVTWGHLPGQASLLPTITQLHCW